MLDATQPTEPCSQLGPDGQPIGTEDCLRLDVTVPAGARHHRPVLVWIHGGNLTSGSASEYDGARLATAGDAVVVTINYRLGALGYLSTPALGRGSGNYGLQDQTAALRWVQRNIARFGGDPDSVTLAGQSAGARSVCAHLASPASRGLFDKAITQSGACALPLATKPAADRLGAQATAEVGCDTAADIAGCLRRQPASALLMTLPGVGSAIHDEMRDDPWGLVVGTSALPRQPIDAIRRGSAAGIPLLIGSAHDEMRAFVGFRHDAAGRPLTEAEYRAYLDQSFGDGAEVVLDRYPVTDFPSPALALSAVLTDWGGSIGACPMLRTAEAASQHAKVFAYEFAEDSGRVFNGYPLGSNHSWDLPFTWDVTLLNGGFPPLSDAQQGLSDQMIAFWASFVRSGDPDGRASDWPRFRAGTDKVLSLSSVGTAPTRFAADHQCGFWNAR